MKPALLDASLDALDALAGYEALCLLVGEDERPLSGAAGLLDWRLCGGLSRLLASGFFGGKSDEKLLLPSDGQVSARKIFAIGLGPLAQVTPLGLEHALASASAMLEKAGVDSAVLALPRLPTVDDATAAAALARAFFEKRPGIHVGAFVEPGVRAKLVG